jgi:hypothetical protein
MTLLNGRPTLRSILRLDGVACLAMGVGMAALAPTLGAFTGLPPGFLLGAGVVLLPTGTFILTVALRREIPAWSVAVIVVGNAAWVLASIALPLLGLVQPNAIGWVLLLGQAAAVAGLTALEQARRPGRQSHMSVA